MKNTKFYFQVDGVTTTLQLQYVSAFGEMQVGSKELKITLNLTLGNFRTVKV